jgi:hypothetical protein
MTDISPDFLFGALIGIGRPTILRVARPDSCILSTSIGIDVLTRFGCEAWPLPIKTIVGNQAWAERYEAEGMPMRPEIGQRWFAEGAHSVGIGYSDGNTAGSWGGHLVIVALPQKDAEPCIIDLSLDQATRPEKDLLVEPFWGRVEPDFLKGKSVAKTRFPNGCVALMEATPDDQSYRQSPNWKDHRVKALITVIESRMRETLRTREVPS